MEKTELKPTKEEFAQMGCDPDTCAGCSLYDWHQMLGQWRSDDGRCTIKIKLGSVNAEEPKCDYQVKRSDV